MEVIHMLAPAQRGQELQIMPTTGWGRWAVGLAAGFVVTFAVFFAFLLTGPGGAATLGFTPQMIPGLLAAACALAALVTGLVGIVVKRERSLLVFAATGIGFLVTAFVIGEFAIPPYD